VTLSTTIQNKQLFLQKRLFSNEYQSFDYEIHENISFPLRIRIRKAYSRYPKLIQKWFINAKVVFLPIVVTGTLILFDK
jgi:hypothetical protein